ncbi:pRL2-8 [Streptomyces sp. NPDC006632]|uniref:pRL2-8 n=1 Tax=Streptomyces sp. NPDC006632 TaxID=3157182 RepID=UPI0033B15D24
MPSKKALNPPAGQCRQCWYHAYASKEAHAHLGPRQDCPECMSHMNNGHGNMIVGR